MRIGILGFGLMALTACGHVADDAAPAIDAGLDAPIVIDTQVDDAEVAIDAGPSCPAPPTVARPQSPAAWVRTLHSVSAPFGVAAKDGGLILYGNFSRDDRFAVDAPLGADSIVVKLAPDGAVQWRLPVSWRGSTSAPDLEPTGAAVRDDGTVVLIGMVRGASVHLGDFTLAAADGIGIIAEISADGRVLDARAIAPGSISLRTIRIAPSGDLVLGASFRGTIDLGAGPWTMPTQEGAFVARYDTAHHLRWATRIGQGEADPKSVWVDEVFLDASERVFVAARTDGATSITGTSVGFDGQAFTPFAFALGSDGTPLWARSLGVRSTIDGGYGYLLGVAPDGLAIFGGRVEGGLDLGEGPRPDLGQYLLATAADGSVAWARSASHDLGFIAGRMGDGFVVRGSADDGNAALEHVSFDGAVVGELSFLRSHVFPFSIAPAPDGDVYVLGQFSDCFHLDGLGDVTPDLTPVRTIDSFIARIRPP